MKKETQEKVSSRSLIHSGNIYYQFCSLTLNGKICFVWEESILSTIQEKSIQITTIKVQWFAYQTNSNTSEEDQESPLFVPTSEPISLIENKQSSLQLLKCGIVEDIAFGIKVPFVFYREEKKKWMYNLGILNGDQLDPIHSFSFAGSSPEIHIKCGPTIVLIDSKSLLINVEEKMEDGRWNSFRLSLPTGLVQLSEDYERYCGPLSSDPLQISLLFSIKDDIMYDEVKDQGISPLNSSGKGKKKSKYSWRKLDLKEQKTDEKWSGIPNFYSKDALIVFPHNFSFILVSKQGELFEFKYGILHSNYKLSSIPKKILQVFLDGSSEHSSIFIFLFEDKIQFLSKNFQVLHEVKNYSNCLVDDFLGIGSHQIILLPENHFDNSQWKFIDSSLFQVKEDYDSMKNLSSVADSLEERVHTAFQELKDIEKNIDWKKIILERSFLLMKQISGDSSPEMENPETDFKVETLSHDFDNEKWNIQIKLINASKFSLCNISLVMTSSEISLNTTSMIINSSSILEPNSCTTLYATCKVAPTPQQIIGRMNLQWQRSGLSKLKIYQKFIGALVLSPFHYIHSSISKDYSPIYFSEEEILFFSSKRQMDGIIPLLEHSFTLRKKVTPNQMTELASIPPNFPFSINLSCVGTEAEICIKSTSIESLQTISFVLSKTLPEDVSVVANNSHFKSLFIFHKFLMALSKEIEFAFDFITSSASKSTFTFHSKDNCISFFQFRQTYLKLQIETDELFHQLPFCSLCETKEEILKSKKHLVY